MERYQVAYGNVRQDKLTQILTIKYAPLLQWREKKLCHITLGAQNKNAEHFQQGKSTRVYNFGKEEDDHGKNRFYT